MNQLILLVASGFNGGDFSEIMMGKLLPALAIICFAMILKFATTPKNKWGVFGKE